MRFAIRHFAAFEDWVEYDDSKITVLAGPNGAGKTSLVQALSLLSEQEDIWRLGFSGSSPPRSFAEALSGREPGGAIELRLATRVDAFAAMLPFGQVDYESVDYPVEFRLSYASDPFDEGASGILTDMAILLTQADRESLLFSVHRSGGEYSLFIDLKEVLHLPFVFARIPSAEDDTGAGRDPAKDFDRVIASLGRLRRIAPGPRKASLVELMKLVQSQKKTIALGQAFVRLIQGQEKGEFQTTPFLIRTGEYRKSFQADEPKYLRSIVDLFVREALMANDIDSLISPVSGLRSRPSFESLFHECLSSARVKQPGSPWRAFRFSRGEDRADGPAATTRRLVDSERSRYGTRLRDLINEAAFKREDGRTGIEEIHFKESYREILEAFKGSSVAKDGFRLVREGGAFSPDSLDLDARTDELRDILRDLGIAEDIALPLPGRDEWPFAIVRNGREEALSAQGEGIRSLVLLAAWATHAPWGSCVALEYPEAGLHPPLQERLAELLVRLKTKYATSFLIETHSERLLRRLATLTAERRLEPGEVAILVCGHEGGANFVRRISLDRKGRLNPPAADAFLESVLG